MRLAVVLVALSALVLAACAQQVTCTDPYILVGDGCCLDRDGNGVCDADEGELEPANGSENLDCSACPPEIITETEEVEVTRYVCSDSETVVDDPAECAAAMAGPESEYDPVLTNEDDQPILEEFTVRSACRGGYNAIEIYFETGSVANDVDFEVKTSPDESYDSVYHHGSSVYERYLYGVFCESPCTGNADFFIDPGEKYLLRGKFDMTETSWEEIYYSNEHVVDATDDGEYMTREC